MENSPEYKHLLTCSPLVLSCLGQAPNDVAVYLRPSRLLPDKVLQFLKNPNKNDDQKAQELLDAILEQVKRDKQAYYTFIKALKDTGFWTNTVVLKLEDISSTVFASQSKGQVRTHQPVKNGASVQPNVPPQSKQDTRAQTKPSTGGLGQAGVVHQDSVSQQQASLETGSSGSERPRQTDFHMSKGVGLSMFDAKDPWELAKIHNDLQLTGEGIKIAVLDTEFFHQHINFQDKLAQILDPVYCFANEMGVITRNKKTACTFPSNHCTAIVDLILQVAPKAKIQIMRVASTRATADSEDKYDPACVTAALNFLIQMSPQDRPDIVSMSFGFPYQPEIDEWERKIDWLESQGTICVAAAGNRGAFQTTIPVPALFGKVVSVGSHTLGGKPSDFTPKSRNIQVFALGENLQAPCLPDDYDYSKELTEIDLTRINNTCAVSGTSMATPCVAGLLALLFQYADHLTNGHCRKNSYVCSVLTSHMQDTMDSLVLRPYSFFTQNNLCLR